MVYIDNDFLGKPTALEDTNHPDWVPSQEMGHSSQKIQKRVADIDRKDRLDKRKKIQMSQVSFIKQN